MGLDGELSESEDAGQLLGESLFLVFQKISRLALERFADRFHGRKSDRLCLAVFQDGDICQCDTDLLGKLGNAHFALRQHDVDIDDDGHNLIR